MAGTRSRRRSSPMPPRPIRGSPALWSSRLASCQSVLLRVRLGEYTCTLFAVVVMAVLTSWVVAALFTPLIGTMLLKPHKVKDEDKDKGSHEQGGRLLGLYRRSLLFTMRHAKITLAVTIVI